MANFIEELFYHNIDPQARMVRNGSNLQKQLGLLSDYEEQLTRTLKDDERKMVLAFVNAVSEVQAESQLDIVNAVSEVQAESQLDSFMVGFRLGARFVFDTFVDGTAPYCDLSENN